MSLDTIMNMSITVESRAPSQPNFGTPLLFGYHTHNLGQLTTQYAQADDMLNDGFLTSDALYKAAQIVKSQNPCPDTFLVGRRVTPLTQIVALTPLNTTAGYKYKGTIGGKAFTYVVGMGETLTTVAAGILAAVNALSAGVTATGDSPASVTGTVVGPWAFVSGDTIEVAIDAEVPGSPETVTFTGVAAVRESSAGTWDLSGGKTLLLSIDGGVGQTISFVDGNFITPTAATATEVAAAINAGLIGGKATVTSGTKVSITSDRKGTGSGVNVSGGTANGGLLAFTTGNVAGSGNVSNLAAVLFAEIKTAIELVVTDCVVTDANGAVKISSLTTGTSSKVLVNATSTLDTTLGIDNATHTGASGANVVTCTNNVPGTVVDFGWETTTPPKYLGMKDMTLDSTTDAELPVVNAENSTWYGLMVIDSSSTPTTLHAAGWIESKRKLFVAQSSDTDVLDPNSDIDTFALLRDSSYARTGGIWHRQLGGVEWLAQGWFAGALTTIPGSATMAFKEIAGVKIDILESGEDSAVLAKNGSHYQNDGLNVTFEGKSGAGEFMDTVRFIDWVYATMRLSVLQVLANNPKIPFTDNGVDIMRLAIMSVIELGQAAGGFAKDPPPTVTAPLVKNVTAANRILRILPDINWTAQLAGAIHRLTPVTGRVSV